MTEKPPACVDCYWYSSTPECRHRCVHPNNGEEYNPVTGKYEQIYYVDCYNLRANHAPKTANICGYEGKWFQPK